MASVISRLVLICGLLVCLCIGVNAQTARPKAVPSANAEGQKAAQYLWNSIFTKCGDAWYYSGSEPDVVGSVPGGSCSAWDVRMWSYKGVRFKLSRLPLSSADALNGVSWRGVAIMQWAAGRGLCKNGKWDEWQDPGLDGYEVLIKKINGQWLYQGAHFLKDLDEKNIIDIGTTFGPQISGAKLASTVKPSCDATGNVKPPEPRIKEQPQHGDPRIKTPAVVPGHVPKGTPQSSIIKKDGEESVASNPQLQPDSAQAKHGN